MTPTALQQVEEKKKNNRIGEKFPKQLLTTGFAIFFFLILQFAGRVYKPGKLSVNLFHEILLLKFMFSKKATKIDQIFTVDLTLCSKCQIHGEDFVNFCGLLRKHEL